MKLSMKDFFCKCDQIRKKLRIWSHLLKKSLMENLFFVEWIQVFVEWSLNITYERQRYLMFVRHSYDIWKWLDIIPIVWSQSHSILLTLRNFNCKKNLIGQFWNDTCSSITITVQEKLWRVKIWSRTFFKSFLLVPLYAYWKFWYKSNAISTLGKQKIKEKQVCLRRILKNQNLFLFVFEAVFKIAFNILSCKK